MSRDPVWSAAKVGLVLGHRLTLVVAAAGWGKSTLLRGLANAVPSIEMGRSVAGWTPMSLGQALSSAMARNAVGPTSDALPAYAVTQSHWYNDQIGAIAAGVSSLAAESIDTDTLVLLDEFDLPPGDPLEQFLEALVLSLPRHVHLVVACRVQPAVPLARLRVAGDVARVSSEDLALTMADLDLADLDAAARAAIEDIMGATGGWPLAVHLASEIVRRTGSIDRAALVDHLLAPNAVLLDYLAEDVLEGLDDRERELLSLAGRVHELSDDLLTAIGRRDLTTALARLTSDRVFLEPVAGSGRHRARVSLLGAAFIQRAMPAPGAALLERVVDALVAAGDIDRALVLSVEVGEPALARRVLMVVDHPRHLTAPARVAEAIELAERDGPDAHLAELRGDLHLLRGTWDDALTEYAYATALSGDNSVRLARKSAGILYLRGRLDDADAVCAAVAPDERAPAEYARVLAYRAVICWVRGDADGCESFVEPAEALAVRAGEDAALATVFTSKAMLAALRGDLVANRRHYQRALLHAERAGDVSQIVRIRTNRGSRFTAEGEYIAALEELDRAIELAEVAGTDTLSALAHCNRGETLLLMGQLDTALAETRRARDIWTRLGSDRVLYALAQLGHVQLLRGQRSEAISIFNETVGLARSQRDTQGAGVALVGLSAALLADDPAAAADAAQRAIDAANATSLPRAHTAAASAALRQSRRPDALRSVTTAIELATTRRDRPALAAALLVRSELDRPPSARFADEAKRLFHDLGNSVGAAMADLLIAESASGQRRDDLVANAERLLYDAGALGPLADARRRPSERGVTSPIFITTLGGFRVSRHGEPVDVATWGSRKARDLVKLLVARRGAPVLRDEVVEVLWPDDADRSARRLSVLLSTVRHVLDPAKSHPPDHYVAADHDTMWLMRDHVDIDVEMFINEAAAGRRRLAAGDTDRAAQILTDAAGRYLGAFCADDPYVDWAAGLRELAKHTFVDTSFELARLADAAGEHSEAIRNWLRILDVDPYDEDSHLGMVASLLAQRRHGAARQAYRVYCSRLGELDLDAAPFPEQPSNVGAAEPNVV